MTLLVGFDQDVSNLGSVGKISTFWGLQFLKEKSVLGKTAKKSLVYVVSYDENTKNSSINLTLEGDIKFEKFMTNNDLDCFYVEDITNKQMRFYKTDGKTIDFMGTIRLYIRNLA